MYSRSLNGKSTKCFRLQSLSDTRIAYLILILLLVTGTACSDYSQSSEPDFPENASGIEKDRSSELVLPAVLCLGVAQDAGYPQAACIKDCCRKVEEGLSEAKYVTSLAIILKDSSYWLLDASPDIGEQMRLVDKSLGIHAKLNGVFLSHAHVGHYFGLSQFGREVMGASGVPVYCGERMKAFLENNGPWDQLVKLGNVDLMAMTERDSISLDGDVLIRSFKVPHRDEYSETLGFAFDLGDKSYLFIPDIDKWEKWETALETILEGVDVAFLDGTFFKSDELPGRDMSEIPHPFVIETIERLSQSKQDLLEHVYFIHFNHTNPLLSDRALVSQIEEAYKVHISKQGEWY